MTKTAPLLKVVPKKRGKGRPVPGENDVGRERLLAATEKLLRTMAPGHVTISRVAREANVNPALVYYYFGNRATLLLAVVDRVTSHATHRAARTEPPAVVLADHIARTVQLGRRAPYMNRLMIDELAQAEAEESIARVRDMNRDVIDFYRELLSADDSEGLVNVDPFYLWIAILGASDFLSSAEPLIRKLVPEGTDMEKLADGYQAFLVKLLMHGMIKPAG